MRAPAYNLTNPFLWVALTIALSLSGTFPVRADTTPCYLCDNIGNLKTLSEPPSEPPKNNACALLAAYVQVGRPKSDWVGFVEGCNSHPDKLVCEATGEIIQSDKIDIKELGLTCKG